MTRDYVLDIPTAVAAVASAENALSRYNALSDRSSPFVTYLHLSLRYDLQSLGRPLRGTLIPGTLDVPENIAPYLPVIRKALKMLHGRAPEAPDHEKETRRSARSETSHAYVGFNENNIPRAIVYDDPESENDTARYVSAWRSMGRRAERMPVDEAIAFFCPGRP